MGRTTRCQAAVVQNGRILLLRMLWLDEGRTFWHPPGGGQEGNENEVQAVIREVKEETGLIVRVERLLFEEPSSGVYQRRATYLCRPVGGTLMVGCEPEEEFSQHQIVEVGWFDLQDESGWGDVLLSDGITMGFLRRVQAALAISPV